MWEGCCIWKQVQVFISFCDTSLRNFSKLSCLIVLIKSCANSFIYFVQYLYIHIIYIQRAWICMAFKHNNEKTFDPAWTWLNVNHKKNSCFVSEEMVKCVAKQRLCTINSLNIKMFEACHYLKFNVFDSNKLQKRTDSTLRK